MEPTAAAQTKVALVGLVFLIDAAQFGADVAGAAVPTGTLFHAAAPVTGRCKLPTGLVNVASSHLSAAMCSLRFAVTALVSVLAVALFSNAFLVNLLLSEEPQKPATTSSLPQPPRLISFESLRASLSVPEEELTTPRGEPRPPRLDPHRLLVRLRRPPFEDAPLLAGAGAAALWASPRELVSASPLELGQALAYLERAEVVRARTPRVGTQLKILLVLEGGWKALFKPQWSVSKSL